MAEPNPPYFPGWTPIEQPPEPIENITVILDDVEMQAGSTHLILLGAEEVVLPGYALRFAADDGSFTTEYIDYMQSNLISGVTHWAPMPLPPGKGV